MHPPQRTSSPDHAPIYLLVMAVGSVSFVIGAGTAAILIASGGEKALAILIGVSVFTFAGLFSALMRNRGII